MMYNSRMVLTGSFGMNHYVIKTNIFLSQNNILQHKTYVKAIQKTQRQRRIISGYIWNLWKLVVQKLWNQNNCLADIY